MKDLTNSLNLLAKHQDAAKRAKQAYEKDYTWDTSLALAQATERVDAQTQNIQAQITTNPRLP